ncbi:hypothetical protein L1987_03180 [Smallanthus sonchifolius]|uniref:Uncharacterized protein n=1 Tax=Smallanthus sonchifolius TaxID=185202 RepID=A0ACB9K9S7_9ASTR|nr:hypothetical protein L1987_03180 [Smallanthus sonchifolius]
MVRLKAMMMLEFLSKEASITNRRVMVVVFLEMMASSRSNHKRRGSEQRRGQGGIAKGLDGLKIDDGPNQKGRKKNSKKLKSRKIIQKARWVRLGSRSFTMVVEDMTHRMFMVTAGE